MRFMFLICASVFVPFFVVGTSNDSSFEFSDEINDSPFEWSDEVEEEKEECMTYSSDFNHFNENRNPSSMAKFKLQNKGSHGVTCSAEVSTEVERKPDGTHGGKMKTEASIGWK